MRGESFAKPHLNSLEPEQDKLSREKKAVGLVDKVLGKDNVGIESVLKTRNIKIKRNPELNYGLIISLFDVDKPPGWKVGSHERSQQRLILHIFLGNHRPLVVPVIPRSRLTSAL